MNTCIKVAAYVMTYLRYKTQQMLTLQQCAALSTTIKRCCFNIV